MAHDKKQNTMQVTVYSYQTTGHVTPHTARWKHGIHMTGSVCHKRFQQS